MRNIFILAYLAVLLFCCKAKGSADSTLMDALLVQSIDYSFTEKWNRTLSENVPIISTCDTVYKNQHFYHAIIINNYATNKDGIASVIFNIKIIRPDKTIYDYRENLTALNKKMLDKTELYLSENVSMLRFKDDDKPGKYLIEMEVQDLISGKKTELSSSIVLAELPAYEHYIPSNDQQLIQWMENYYIDPKPEEMLAYYVYYTQSKLADDDERFWQTFSFFHEIASHNSFLEPQIIQCFQKQDQLTQFYLIYLLYYAKIGNSTFFEQLSGDEKELFLELQEEPMHNLYDTISQPAHLDMLWYSFRANGSYEPIKKLIKELDYCKDFDESENVSGNTQKMKTNALCTALIWSLTAHCKNNELVRSYCRWAFEYEQLNELQRVYLGTILSETR